MTLRELIDLFRYEVDDVNEPCMWSTPEVIDFANDAQQEAARRARLLVDSATAGIASVTAAAADNGLLALDARVIFVRRIRAAGALPLQRMTLQDMETINPYWQDAPAGTPRLFIPDFQTGKLVLHPKPAVDTAYALTVVREPLVDMAQDQDEPEIAKRWHRSLRHWMIFRAYAKQDSEAADPKKAAAALALFEQEFGGKSSAIEETWIAREQFDHDGTF